MAALFFEIVRYWTVCDHVSTKNGRGFRLMNNISTNNSNTTLIIIGTVIVVLLLVLVFGNRMMTGDMMRWWR
jgi:hypothetical protein